MKKSSKAAFSFETYKFISFQFTEHANEGFEGLNILIEPSGIYSLSDRIYILTLDFKASLTDGKDELPNEENSVIQLKLEANFKIDSEDGTIPEYFYPNSIGITFPYIRSFLSTLTLQANIQQVLLPLMNLSYLAEPLKSNTVIK